MEKLCEKVYCSHCKTETNHQVIYTHECRSNPTEDYFWCSKYHIVECLGCETVAFVEQYSDENNWKYIDGGRVWYDEFKIYPEKPKEETLLEGFDKLFQITEKQFTHAPEEIQNLYMQIIDAFNRKHYILCISGLRTLIEGICSQLEIKKGFLYNNKKEKVPDNEGKIRKHKSLGGRIFEIFDKGYILFEQALLLQKVVRFGNMAIHEMEAPEYPIIKEIINIVERLIHDVYELKNHELFQLDKSE